MVRSTHLICLTNSLTCQHQTEFCSTVRQWAVICLCKCETYNFPKLGTLRRNSNIELSFISGDTSEDPEITRTILHLCRPHWPCGLRRGSTSPRLLGLWVRNPPGTWISVFCESYVLSGRGHCDGLFSSPEESYRLWCVWVWSWNLDCEEFGPLGAVKPWKDNSILVIYA